MKPRFGSPVLTDALACQILAHQSAVDAANHDPDSAGTIDLTPALMDKLKRSEELEKREASLLARELAVARKEQMDRLRLRCSPLQIGGKNGIHPSSLDIEIQECEKIDGFPSYIAWIPCPIYPLPTTPVNKDGSINKERAFYTDKAGNTSPNYDLGKVSITESFATVTIASGRLNSQKQMILRTVGLRGYAGLSLSNLTPEEVEKRLARREMKALNESVGLTADNDFEVDSAATGTTDLDSPAFIPSHAKTVRESRPLSKGAPFDTDGNAR